MQMFYHSPSVQPTPTFAIAPSPALTSMQWLNALSPYQQALILPLLQQMNTANSPSMNPIVIDDQPIAPQPMFTTNFKDAPASPFLASSTQRSPNFFGDNLNADSTQENSPRLAFYNLGTGVNNDFFSLQDAYGCNPAKHAFSTVKPSLHHPQNMAQLQSNDSTSKKMKKVNAKQAVTSSPASPAALNQNSLLGSDDKNIIHINFTKNLLKSFRRHCEYFHKSNPTMIASIKEAFDTNHMNNQLLVHFMTSSITIDAFKTFVDGPAQKWVKEQSRLKKQDQQLELIEICRQRLFDKIKVKKYSDSANPIPIDETNQGESQLESQSLGQVQAINKVAKPSVHSTQSRKRPIFSALKSHQTNQTATEVKIQKESDSDSMSSSSSSSSDSFGNNDDDIAINTPYKRVCSRNEEEMVVLREEVETKIEDIDHTIKIEDDSEEN